MKGELTMGKSHNNKYQHQEPAPEKQVPQEEEQKEEQKEEGAQPEQPATEAEPKKEGVVVLPKLERNWFDNMYDRINKRRMAKLLKQQEEKNNPDKKKNSDKKKKILGVVGFVTGLGLAAAGGAAYANHKNQIISSDVPMPELPAMVTDTQPAPDPYYDCDCGNYHQEDPGMMPDVTSSEYSNM